MFTIEVDNHDVHFGHHKISGYYIYVPWIKNKNNEKTKVFIVNKDDFSLVIKKLFFANSTPDDEIDYDFALTIVKPYIDAIMVLSKPTIARYTHCYKCKTTLVSNDDWRCDKCFGIICPKCNSCMCDYFGSNA